MAVMGSGRNLICLCTDQAMLPAAYAAAQSAKDHGNRTDLRIYLNGSLAGLPLEHVDEINPAAHIPPEIGDGHLPASTYLRLIVPDLARDRYDRVLYVDADMIDETGLDDLFSLNLKGRTLAAVANQFGNRHDHAAHIRYRAEIGIDPQRPFLNAGILLIDVAAWIERRTTQRCLEYLLKMHRRINGMDQDALNAVLGDAWLELSPSFNLQTTYFDLGLERAMPIRVRHYKGPVKPWHDLAWRHGGEHTARYGEIFAPSPWPNFIAEQRTWTQRRLALRYKIRDLRWKMRSMTAGFSASARRRIEGRDAEIAAFRRNALTEILSAVESGRYADVEQGLTAVDVDMLRQMIRENGG